MQASNGSALDIGHLIDQLTQCRRPYLIGVRHHSPALSVAMPSLLDQHAPDVVAVELPAEASQWLDWLTHPEARTPLALAFSRDDNLSFYPFADFSPELAALRWARRNGVEVACIDLPVAAGDGGIGSRVENEPEPQLQAALARRARAGQHDHGETWDRLVEAPAPRSSPDQLRRAALAHGLATRRAEGEIDAHTVAREEHMRACLSAQLAASKRVVAVVGSFHAPALLETTPPQSQPAPAEVSACLVGYSFAQLDARSGYPAGIRDPAWQQTVVESGLDAETLNATTATLITRIARELREAGHPAGPGEAAETLRVASDLATIRGLRAPSRRELIEAVTTVLAQGEVLGRGRAVADALQRVLIGERVGKVAPGTPVSALRANLMAELRAEKLPVTGTQELRLAPLRGGSDLRRHVLLRRLTVAGISYARSASTQQWRGADTVTESWSLAWTPATDASIELAAPRGLNSEQLATNTLLTRAFDAYPEDLLADAADCGSARATERGLTLIAEQVATSDFSAAVTRCGVLADIATARLPGARLLPAQLTGRAGELCGEFTSAALRELSGILGSDRDEDAAALARFHSQAADRKLSLAHHMTQLAEAGSPLMQGAATGLLLATDDSLGSKVASWLSATSASGRTQLRRRVAGLLITASAHFQVSGALGELIERVNRLSDEHFVAVLPALRGGFDVLTDQMRQTLLEDLATEFGRVRELVLPAEETLAIAGYDTAARARLAALGLADLAFSPAERWRLILGAERDALSGRGRRMASALDELYGLPGADALDAGHRQAGAGPSQLGVREWEQEIEVLFGDTATQEIFGQAAATGRGEVLERLDPEKVRPSVDLLTTALSLTGALSEARLAKLRPLVARLVRELTEALAVRVRPALTGLSTPRPSRRKSGELDLARTIRANLGKVVNYQGRPQVVPANPVFRQPGNKEADWHLIVVVDTSGSMSESVVFAALTTAILAGVSCLEVTFLAFSTEVIDFSGRVDDPLALLLEVDIGGGTNIAGAMRVARSRVKVPSRTLCALISDFDEYGSTAPLLAEVEALHAAGVRLLGCAALTDTGVGAYNVGIAQQVAAAGMRVAALSPLELAHWVAKAIRQ